VRAFDNYNTVLYPWVIFVHNAGQEKALDTVGIAYTNLDMIFFAEAGVWIQFLTLPKNTPYRIESGLMA
jgi:hypothetical protein